MNSLYVISMIIFMCVCVCGGGGVFLFGPVYKAGGKCISNELILQSLSKYVEQV